VNPPVHTHDLSTDLSDLILPLEESPWS
jgi:hypothetical protein